MPKSSFCIRFALVAIFAVIALGFLLPPSQAQPGGRPPGFSSPPRPPGMPAPPRPPGAGISGAGISGAGIHGISGAGIHGVSGISGAGITGIHGTGIHGISGAGIHGISGAPGGIGGMPGPPRSEWVCSGCRYVVGTGPIRPNVQTCPGCGARFSNPGIGPPGGGGVPPGGGAPPAGGGGVAPGGGGVGDGPSLLAPELPPNPAAGGSFSPLPPAPEPVVTPPSASSSSTSDSSGSSASDEPAAPSGRSKTLKLIGIVCGSILLLGALAALGVVVANASSSKPTKRGRRRVLDD
jgi:hypothetical protein